MDESSQSKVTRCLSERKKENPDKKMDFPDKGIDFLRESELGKPSKARNSGSQELTLSYLCENSKQAFLEQDFSGKNPLLERSHKGKEVLEGDGDNDDKWVERDFLNLNNSSSKREIDDEEEEEMERESKDKRQKLETLNLSLALPDVSLSLTASNALHKPTRSVQSLTYNSNDYTAAASLSYSHSHPFSHNPSCSLTRNSTENYEYSVGKDDQIWNCGEGTNGSVHSRFKPIGDGHIGVLGLYSLMQGNNNNKKDSDNNVNNHSFFPSELPARPVRIVENNSTNNNNNNNFTQSGDSRGKAGSENLRGLDRPRKKVSRPERIVREIVSESVPVMAQTIQELSEETIMLAKEYLRSLISEKKDELVNLQTRLERRSDLTKETLSKCQKDQLEILVAVKLGLVSFLSAKNRLPSSELVEVFLFMRCRNVNCKSLLPVDDCDCKICSGNKGFCSTCMCPVCLNFDCASNTCSWVGCDVCSHWCHASCGIQRNLIKPGPSLKGPSGTSEMQFHCIGCGHASEMFGFVKDVFLCCAKDWALETFLKELDCVRKIFRGSDDFKGKELYHKAEEIITKLGSKLMSPKDACSFITQFFNYGLADFPSSGLSAKELVTNQSSLRKDATPVPQPASLPAKYAAYNMSSSLQRDMLPNDLRHSDLKASLLSSEDDFRFRSLSKPDGFDSLESIVRIKEAEARMFQTKADEARREAEEYHRVIRATMEKMEGEYAEKLTKLRLQETEERRRKKLEELKVLENSHCDYYKMKIRMQAEITGLLERMEATKQQWV
ncbi:protein OBERON 3 isoform X2 [Morus notabilis]|uniref:protein OBERON 3 isoform X2 n=1 Tax=Morus notabilis TaxID=981085 RepID=UPI000CED12FF|nr:protein OBERON 3 isoform X2 [Morus notabilis]